MVALPFAIDFSQYYGAGSVELCENFGGFTLKPTDIEEETYHTFTRTIRHNSPICLIVKKYFYYSWKPIDNRFSERIRPSDCPKTFLFVSHFRRSFEW